MQHMKLFTFCAYLAAFLLIVYCDSAPFKKCEEREGTAKDIKVEVSNCNSTERCNLLRGSNAHFVLQFTPSSDLDNKLERTILAQFPSKNKPVDVPYGPSIDISESTFEVEGRKSFSSVRKDLPLVHEYLFPVLKGAPNATLIVRYVIRENIETVKRNQKNWKLHPGQVLVCIEIPVQLV